MIRPLAEIRVKAVTLEKQYPGTIPPGSILHFVSAFCKEANLALENPSAESLKALVDSRMPTFNKSSKSDQTKTTVLFLCADGLTQHSNVKLAELMLLENIRKDDVALVRPMLQTAAEKYLQFPRATSRYQ